MKKDWTNREIQADPQGYLAWQKEQQGKDEREAKKKRDEADFQQFQKLYEERGGDPSEPRAMYKKYRSDKALEETKRLDQEARGRMRADRSRAV